MYVAEICIFCLWTPNKLLLSCGKEIDPVPMIWSTTSALYHAQIGTGLSFWAWPPFGIWKYYRYASPVAFYAICDSVLRIKKNSLWYLFFCYGRLELISSSYMEGLVPGSDLHCSQQWCLLFDIWELLYGLICSSSDPEEVVLEDFLDKVCIACVYMYIICILYL